MQAPIPFILIVDDDEDDHYLLKAALKEVMPEIETHSLYDGSQALNYLTEGVKDGFKTLTKPQLIFLDINMGKLNGFETALLLKGDDQLKEIPIVILTTSSDLPEKARLTELVEGFYQKPAQSLELQKIVIEIRNKFFL